MGEPANLNRGKPKYPSHATKDTQQSDQFNGEITGQISRPVRDVARGPPRGGMTQPTAATSPPTCHHIRHTGRGQLRKLCASVHTHSPLGHRTCLSSSTRPVDKTSIPAVYPRLVEFLHFDIHSTGQKTHRIYNPNCYGESSKAVGGVHAYRQHMHCGPADTRPRSTCIRQGFAMLCFN